MFLDRYGKKLQKKTTTFGYAKTKRDRWTCWKKNIINTIFSRYYNDILEHYPVKVYIRYQQIYLFKNTKQIVEKKLLKEKGIMGKI